MDLARLVKLAAALILRWRARRRENYGRHTRRRRHRRRSRGDDEMDDPWPRPTRTEPRGVFPAPLCHAPPRDARDRPVLTAEAARRIARDRLEQWRRDHE